ncbi:TadE/TadG family type IV pilus assembly protein [Methylolobus aquaticus]
MHARVPLSPRVDAGSRCRCAQQSGSAFIELSFVVLTLFVLLVGTVELTLLLLDYNRLTKNVRDAAQFLSSQAIDPATAAWLPTSTALGVAYGGGSLEQIVANLVHCGREAPCANPPDGQSQVTAEFCRDHDGLSYAIVQAEYPHPFTLWPERLRTVFGESITLRASAMTRIASLAGDNRAGTACQR